MGAAARRIDDDLGVGPRERLDVGPRELACALAVARMRMERATTRLLRWNAHLVAVALEQPDRGPLSLSERLAHDAAREDAYVGVAALHPAERRALRARRERRRPAKTTGKPRRQPRDPKASGKVGETRGDRKPSRLGDGVKRGARESAIAFALSQHLARAFHDPTKGNAGGTRGLARAADETRFEMADRRRARRGGRAHDLTDQLDAAPRRVRLFAKHAIGRTVVEAEPARDTCGEIVGTDVG